MSWKWAILVVLFLFVISSLVYAHEDGYWSHNPPYTEIEWEMATHCGLVQMWLSKDGTWYPMLLQHGILHYGIPQRDIKDHNKCFQRKSLELKHRGYK